MKLSQLNEWMTLLSNLGVLVGIFILVVELDQNTTAVRNEAVWSRVAVTNDIQQSISETEIGTLMLEVRGMSEAEYRRRLEGPERAALYRVRHFQYRLLLVWEARFITLESPEDRAALEGNIRRNAASSGALRAIYTDPRMVASLRPDFVEFLLDVIARASAESGGPEGAGAATTPMPEMDTEVAASRR